MGKFESGLHYYIYLIKCGKLLWALLKNRQVERQVESQVERRVERQVKALLDDSALPDDFSLPDDDDFSIL